MAKSVEEKLGFADQIHDPELRDAFVGALLAEDSTDCPGCKPNYSTVTDDPANNKPTVPLLLEPDSTVPLQLPRPVYYPGSTTEIDPDLQLELEGLDNAK